MSPHRDPAESLAAEVRRLLGENDRLMQENERLRRLHRWGRLPGVIALAAAASVGASTDALVSALLPTGPFVVDGLLLLLSVLLLLDATMTKAAK